MTTRENQDLERRLNNAAEAIEHAREALSEDDTDTAAALAYTARAELAPLAERIARRAESTPAKDRP